MPARVTAALMATAPSSGADNGARPPRNLPIGVRAAETITGSREGSDIEDSRIWTCVSYQLGDGKIKSGRGIAESRRTPPRFRYSAYSATAVEVLRAERNAARYRIAAMI